MPIYEYRCGEGEGFEKLQPMADREEASCPTHGSPGRLRPSLNGPVFWFPRPPGKDGFTSKQYSTRREALHRTRPSEIVGNP